MKDKIYKRYGLHDRAGVELLITYDVTVATVRVLYESFASLRWSHTLGEIGKKIKEIERRRGTLPKYVAMKEYISQAGVIEFTDNVTKKLIKTLQYHGDVYSHTNNLIEMVEKYEDNGDSFIKTLKKALIIHDLSEVKLQDKTQFEGKTPEFKRQEYEGGKEIISRLYHKMPEIERDMLTIYDELEAKGELYNYLKIYEEFSHLLGCMQIQKEFDSTGMDGNYYDACIEFRISAFKHIEKILGLRGQYPCVDKFLQEYGSDISAYFDNFPQDNFLYNDEVVKEFRRIYSIFPYIGK